MGEKTLDVRGLKCPMPIIKAKTALQSIRTEEVLKVVATDPGSVLDFQGWLKLNPSYKLVAQEQDKDETGRDVYVTKIAKGG